MDFSSQNKRDRIEVLKPEKISELIEELLLPSGSEDVCSEFDDSDADPTIDPNELESYSSSDNESDNVYS